MFIDLHGYIFAIKNDQSPKNLQLLQKQNVQLLRERSEGFPSSTIFLARKTV